MLAEYGYNPSSYILFIVDSHDTLLHAEKHLNALGQAPDSIIFVTVQG